MRTRRHLITRVGRRRAPPPRPHWRSPAPVAGASSHAHGVRERVLPHGPDVPLQGAERHRFSTWQKWAKTYLPFWQKLASEAPSKGSKAVLNELVSIIKYEANAKNYTQIGAYVAAHEKWWTNGWASFAKDVEGCAASLY